MTQETTSLDSVGKVTIVGGGPAGATMAALLGQRGHQVIVYESRPDLRRTDIDAGRSINLALAERGLHALEQIGIRHEVLEICLPMAGRMIHTDDGENFQPYGSRPGEVIYSVTRTGINAALLDAAEATGNVQIEFNQRCRSVDLDSKTMVLTDESDGDRPTTVSFEMLIGADGVMSPVRDAIIASNHGSVTIDPLDHGYKELELAALNDTSEPFGRFALDPGALHIWPRGNLMLIALPNPEGDFTCTLFMPNDGDPDSFAAVTTPDEIATFFAREFPSFVPLMGDLVEQYLDAPLGHLGTVRTTGWSYGARAVLIGDSAHGIVPFHGQGMNAALESAVVLDRHLTARPDDVGLAFAEFEAERRGDTDAIAQMALDNYLEMRSGVVDPDYLIKRSVALELERRFPTHFAPRYGMVMFTTIPYADVLVRTRRQAEILTELTTGISSVDELDAAKAAELVTAMGPIPAEDY